MDKLIRISADHKTISEMPSMYREIISRANFYNPLDYVDSLNKIFKDTILPHFDFEEKEIFPLIIEMGNIDAKAMIPKLNDDHVQFRQRLEQINKIKSGFEIKPDVRVREELTALCGQITRDLSEHALKEDTIVFPLLKDAGFDQK